MLTLPFTTDAAQQFTVQLGEDKWTLDARYNERSASWTFDITRDADQLVVLRGVPLLIGQDMLEPYTLGIGALIAADLVGPQAGSISDAGPDDLGDRVQVAWLSPEEQLVINGDFSAGGLARLAAAVTRAGGSVTFVVQNITNVVNNTGNIISNTTTVQNLLVPLVDNREHADSTGDEVLVSQFSADLTPNPSASVTLDVSFLAASAAGTATYRIYVGGTIGAVDGTLIGSATRSVVTLAALRITGSLTNPHGMVPVKITMQSSGAGVDAVIDDLTGTIG